MKCPACSTEQLVMAERQGIEIDYCPKCRGVWLDRGELDKIIERSARDEITPTHQPSHPQPGYPHRPMRPDDSDYGHHQYKRKSWLREIFD